MISGTGESLTKEIQNGFTYKQSTFPSVPSFLTFPTVPTLQPFFETARSYIKTGYRTYLLLNPEVKMGQCVIRYFYTQYPGVMRFFQAENISKFIRRLYIFVGRFVNSILSGDIFTDAVKRRVESKVVLMTREEQKQKPPQPIYIPYQTYYQPWPIMNYNLYSPHQRFARQVPSMEFGVSNATKSSVAKKQLPPPLVDNVSVSDIDSDARIDLTDRKIEREADQLFNVDAMFWKSLGIEENALKKYSLSYCAKDYVTDIFRRFVKNIILS